MNRTLETPSQEWIARFLAEMPSSIALFDGEARYVAASRSWLETFGIFARPVQGQHHDAVGYSDGPQLSPLLRRALAGEVIDACETAAHDPGGRWRRWLVSVRPLRDDDGAVSGVAAAVQELDTFVAAQTLHQMPDVLTGLAGRHGFTRRIRDALANPTPERGALAVFIIDIDSFKSINDLHGIRAGDTVLKIIANRLVSGTRSRIVPAKGTLPPAHERDIDMVARLGADEFGIILGGPAPSLPHAQGFAQRLLQLVQNPISEGDLNVRLTASVGYVITSAIHRSEDDVLRDLDIALQEAKARGLNNTVAWEPNLTNTVSRRLFLAEQLRRALDNNEFVLHYQPILRLGDSRVVGAEALLRWNHPSDGLIPPAAFLPVLEETGLIVPVGCWIMREAVRQMQVWQMLYGRDILDWLSINVSARQFNDPSLLLQTLAEINDSGFPLDRLKVEITESAVMRSPENTRAVLSELHELGISVALDDFGTGYSSLGTLRQYAVDTIKIDAGFTSRLDTEDGRELVLALLKIARIYGAEIVAEGIETPAQRDILRDSECGLGQGFLFARPMDGRAFGVYALTHLVEIGNGNGDDRATDRGTDGDTDRGSGGALSVG